MDDNVKELRYKNNIYNEYTISNNGKIYNKRMQKEIKQAKGSGNRILIYLANRGKKPIRARVDELLINSFYPEIDIYNRQDLKIVYKDGDYTNLTLDNLIIQERPSYKIKENKKHQAEITKEELSKSDEVWKGIITPDGIDISDYYMVSSKGRIYSKKRDRIIKSVVKSKDLEYNKCLISVKELGIHKQYLIGRIVASTFLGIPNKPKLVKHRNGNTLDDSVENIYYV